MPPRQKGAVCLMLHNPFLAAEAACRDGRITDTEVCDVLKYNVTEPSGILKSHGLKKIVDSVVSDTKTSILPGTFF